MNITYYIRENNGIIISYRQMSSLNATEAIQELKRNFNSRLYKEGDVFLIRIKETTKGEYIERWSYTSQEWEDLYNYDINEHTNFLNFLCDLPSIL